VPFSRRRDIFVTQFVKIDLVPEKLSLTVENVRQFVRDRQIPEVRLSRKIWRLDLQRLKRPWPSWQGWIGVDALFSGSLTADTPHHSRPAETTSWKIGLLNQRACQLQDASISEHEAVGREWACDRDLAQKKNTKKYLPCFSGSRIAIKHIMATEVCNPHSSEWVK
jgi:hypothetical protein